MENSRSESAENETHCESTADKIDSADGEAEMKSAESDAQTIAECEPDNCVQPPEVASGNGATQEPPEVASGNGAMQEPPEVASGNGATQEPPEVASGNDETQEPPTKEADEDDSVAIICVGLEDSDAITSETSDSKGEAGATGESVDAPMEGVDEDDEQTVAIRLAESSVEAVECQQETGSGTVTDADIVPDKTKEEFDENQKAVNDVTTAGSAEADADSDVVCISPMEGIDVDEADVPMEGIDADEADANSDVVCIAPMEGIDADEAVASTHSAQNGAEAVKGERTGSASDTGAGGDVPSDAQMAEEDDVICLDDESGSGAATCEPSSDDGAALSEARIDEVGGDHKCSDNAESVPSAKSGAEAGCDGAQADAAAGNTTAETDVKMVEERCEATAANGVAPDNDDDGKFEAAERPTYPAKHALPDGWKEVYHESGATIYVHVESGVCSLCRPYQLENLSHPIRWLPYSAVPCFMYRKNKDFKFLKRDGSGGDAAAVPKKLVVPKPNEELMEYCSRLFRFTTVKYPKFRSWDAQRKYKKAKRDERLQQQQESPPPPNAGGAGAGGAAAPGRAVAGGSAASSNGVLGRDAYSRGRSYVAILRDYLLQSRNTSPTYQYCKSSRDEKPYAAAVLIDGVGYGAGVGSSQKEAKVEAAKDTLNVLLPNMMKYVFSVNCEKYKYDDGSEDEADGDAVPGSSPLDDVEIGDPRVLELSTAAKPYDVLLRYMRQKECDDELKLNFQNKFETCTMSLGLCKVTISCANADDGRQRAAQSLLELLHPHIRSWGSLLRLYDFQC